MTALWRARVFAIFLFLLAILGAGGTGASGGQSVSIEDAIRARIEQLQKDTHLQIRGRRLWQPEAVRSLLAARSSAPLWRGRAAFEQIVQAIRAIDRDGLTPADYHLAAIDTILTVEPGSLDSAAAADLQLLLTDAVAAMIDHSRYGKVRPVVLNPLWNVDPRFAAPPLDTLVERVGGSHAIADELASLRPNHFIYVGLTKALASLRDVAAGGGWTRVTEGAAIKPGGSDPRIAAIRKRLTATGELAPGTASDSGVYDAELQAAVIGFQERHRITADGVIGRGTVQAMNVTAETRIGQLRANLERARWVLNGLPDSFLLVNLPAFKTYLINDRLNVWETRVQIGKDARQTPSFRGEMQYLVFNPDWTVPPTILAQDVLAGMRRGENTIARKKLVILDRQGQKVEPGAIDWSNATAASFPYTLQQPPGSDNALGRVKFIFPNPHSIFLHDTPSRSLFTADQRTFSSGCIRVEKPLDLAALLLKSRPEWTPKRIQHTIEAGATETVHLTTPLPVVIVYWTVSVGASGELRYARDVYDLDPPLLRALDAR
jgi:L,D-transpeptidase YcbB